MSKIRDQGKLSQLNFKAQPVFKLFPREADISTFNTFLEVKRF
jgi:hypothetical protein